MTNETLDRLVAEKVCGETVTPVMRFSSDLNACHWAEMRLKEDLAKWVAYDKALARVVKDRSCVVAATLDARTRCLAMLKTMGVEVSE